MRFVDGLTQSDIASRLGVSQMQISRLLASSIQRLRESFSEDRPPNDS
jgi:RNA polymerase sigma-B factor